MSKAFLLAVLLAGAVLLASVPAARAAAGPCIADYPHGAQCTVWKGKVKWVDDGDTLDADVPGDGLGGVLRVRITGIQAMEQTSYRAAQRAGDCHAVEATDRLEQLVSPSKRRVRVTSATFLAAQVDFSHAGDLMVFVDEDQISALEREMQVSGVLEGSKMAMAFNMLRSNDLIWSYVVSNYLKGQPPSAFDLLHWNSDATRMPAANHSYYLRNCYLENRLSTGSMVLDNTLLDLTKVKVPIYNLATREDHIAPADSVLYGSQFFGGPVKYVLSGSGHIAGVINPPASGKYQFWTNDNIKDITLTDWLKGAQEHKGSWWPDWREWLEGIGAEEVPARAVGTDAMPALEDAPGSYVRVRA